MKKTLNWPKIVALLAWYIGASIVQISMNWNSFQAGGIYYGVGLAILLLDVGK